MDEKNADRVVVTQLGWFRLRRSLWRAQFKLMFRVAVLAAWVDHRAALRSVGIGRRLFLGEARRDAAAWLASTTAVRPALRRVDRPQPIPSWLKRNE